MKKTGYYSSPKKMPKAVGPTPDAELTIDLEARSAIVMALERKIELLRLKVKKHAELSIQSEYTVETLKKIRNTKEKRSG